METTNGYVIAAIALAGSLIGAVTAAAVSWKLAKHARADNLSQWARDERREAFANYLTVTQATLDACQKRGPLTKGAAQSVDTGTLASTYAVVQMILADDNVFGTARILMYRLLALSGFQLGTHGNTEDFWEITTLVRQARHATIDAMRAELGMEPIFGDAMRTELGMEPRSGEADNRFDAFRGTRFEGKGFAS